MIKAKKRQERVVGIYLNTRGTKWGNYLFRRIMNLNGVVGDYVVVPTRDDWVLIQSINTVYYDSTT